MERKTHRKLLQILVVALGLIALPLVAEDKRPNIVFILTDNQGAWQLGCYGNPDFKTPNIDRMAKEGTLFTNAFANNAVCSPTRATYLTGLTPSQHGVHRYLSAGRLQVGPEADYTLEEFTTLPEILHQEGYVCGLSGKWHLGDNVNPQDGFSFWVTKQHGHSPGFLNQDVVEDGKVKKIRQHLSEYWTDRGIEFIEKTQREQSDKPFFLFLAYNGPYTLSGAMRETVPSPWSDPYRESQLPSFPRPDNIHPWQRNQHDLIGDLQAGRNLAGQVTAVDAGVGRILETLKQHHLDEDTIVIYAADQGAVAGHAGFWGMGDHTIPLHGRDGTMHIPMIFRWPEKIPAGRVEDRIVTNYDFMPSVLSLLGLEMPTEPLVSPGRDFSATLRGEGLDKWEDEIFYEFENVRSIRTPDWKYGERLGEGPTVEFYDLKTDPDELNNLASAEVHADLREKLQQRLHAWFEKNTDPKWDLWKGGGSKSRIGTAREIASGIKKRAEKADPNPKHRAIHLQGLHAYPGSESVAAGGSIHFHVSSEFPYRFRVTKLGLEVDDRGSDKVVHTAPNGFEPEVQAIHPGSYLKVEKGLPGDEELKALTVECWVRPWKLKGWQGIVTQHDYPTSCGYGLFLDDSGRPVFSIGSGGEYDKEAKVVGTKLNLRQWHHLVGTWDGERAMLWIDGKSAGEWKAPDGMSAREAGSAALRIGAYADGGSVSNFLDGDIAMPAIYGKALDEQAIANRFESKALKAPDDESVIAFWPLEEERGNTVADGTGKGRDAEIVNLGTWMIGGPSFDASSVDRHDDNYDPSQDEGRGHGLRLASDDLYDCEWETSHTWKVPKTARSGIYAAWFDFEKEGVMHRYPVTFVVNKAKDAKKAPIALLCSTTTWRAYNGTPFGENVPRDNRFYKTGGVTNDSANPPAWNLYRDHASGQPTYQMGLRMPWPAAGPDVHYSPAEVGYSHLMRGERFTHVWLEKQGYDFDVYTSLDLHRNPDLLDGYRTLILNGHDEYWSIEMYEGVDRYLKKGGTTAVLSGNTMFWRVSFDEELGTMECRKYGPTIGGRKFASVGEIFHSYDQKRGSLMRYCGYPAWKNIGLECSGWWGGSNNGSYTTETPDHFLFQTPEKIDFSDRQTFGHAQSGYRQACGHEGDIRISSFPPAFNQAPEGAIIPEEPAGMQTLASLSRDKARALDYFAEFGQTERATLVDMIYWERPSGGKVFHAGAIAFGWTLDADPKQTRLMRNVLFHLAGVKAKTPYDPEWLADPNDEVAGAPAAGRPAPGTPAAGRPAPTNPKKAIVPETDHALILRSGDAGRSGPSVKINPSHGALAWWKSEKDVANWKIRNAKSGTYTVALDYAVPKELAGQEFVLIVGKAKLTAKAASTGGWGKWAVRVVGEIKISEPDLTVAFRPAAKVKGEDLLDLRAIQLIPTGSPRLKNLKPVAVASDPDIPTTARTLAGNKPAPVNPGSDGVFTLLGKIASLYGEPITLIPSTDPNHPEAAIAGWRKKGERASWQLRGLKAGRYDLLVDWAMPRVPGGLQKAALTLDGEPLFSGNIRTTEGEDRFAAYVIGTIDLPAGDHEISFGPDGTVRETWVRLRSLRLVPAASEGEFTIPPLTVPEGFTIEPAALPPLVGHPMMACLDDRGRMFIAESAGSNAQAPELLETRPHKILMLEDMDEDGVFDKSTVFAENLVLPNGAQWHDGALYVCSPPYVWKFEDTDDDGRAEKQTPVFGKFGFNGMSSAFHGPVLGPDGRMYFCGGQHGWTLGDTSPGLDLAGPWISRGPGVFSMWPDGSDSENRAQGGMANPVEVTFSSEGEVFGTVAVYENLNGRTDALLHWIHGTVYNLKRRGPPVHPLTSRENLPPMSRRGWVAPPGLTRYRSGEFANGFGEQYRDDIFLCEFNTHRVYRIMPERSGASYTTTDEIFLESTSPYTHFTDVFEDADGSLLVVDTGGWFLYGCPTSAIERPEIKGGIYRIRKEGSNPISNLRGQDLDWKNPDVDWLDDPRFTVRDRAKTELAKMGEAVIPALGEILKDPKSSERHRREAIWTLTRIDHPSAREVAQFSGLEDPSPSVRLTAARSASVWRGGPTRAEKMTAAALLQPLIRNSDKPQIIREAATALGRMKVAGETVDTLINAVRKNGGKDRYLDHSLIYALIEIDHESYTQTFLNDNDPNVQRAALIACAEMKSTKLTAEMVAPLLSAADPNLRAEALRISSSRSEWGGSLIGFLRSSIEAGSASPSLSDALLAFSGNAEVQTLIAEAVSSPVSRVLALDVMNRSELKAIPKSWESALAKALSESPDLGVMETIRSLGIRSLDDNLLALASSEETEISLRFAALETIADRLPSPMDHELFDFALQCFGPEHSVQRRTGAARVLALASLTPDQTLLCARQLVPEAGPLQIEPLLGVFENGPDSSEIRNALAEALETSPGLFSVPSNRVEQLFGKEQSIALPILKKLRAAESQRDQRLDELAGKIAQHTGDPERGKAAYVKATCVVCHKAQELGGVIGPELTTIGSIRSERDLLEAIAFPSATFAREYEPWLITLKNGEMRFGRLGRETDDTLELIDAQGQSTRVPVAQVQNREMAPVSMMPPGLERLLSDAELADLIAYLRSLNPAI